MLIDTGVSIDDYIPERTEYIVKRSDIDDLVKKLNAHRRKILSMPPYSKRVIDTANILDSVIFDFKNLIK